MGSLKLILTAIVQFFTIFGPLLTMMVKGITSLIDFIVDYVTLETKRLRDQIAYENETRRLALEGQRIREQANVAAFKSIIEEAWLARYNDILAKISKEDYTGVLKLTSSFDNEEVDKILFDLSQSPEYRAMKIVKRMRGTK